MALYDVGIVGCWYWGNYGSLLNGYATFSLVKEIGLKPLNIVTPYNGFEPHAKRFFEAVYEKDDISECLPFEELMNLMTNVIHLLQGLIKYGTIIQIEMKRRESMIIFFI